MKKFWAGLLAVVLLCLGIVSSIYAAPDEESQNPLILDEGQIAENEGAEDEEVIENVGAYSAEKSIETFADDGLTAYAAGDGTGKEVELIESNAIGDEERGEQVKHWQVNLNGTDGWTFSGFAPWQEDLYLVAWSENGIDATFSYTFTNIPNGRYTLENNISVKDNMTAVMGLQSGTEDMHSPEFSTSDTDIRYRLNDMITVTNHEVTVYYILKAAANTDGATFKLGNMGLYRMGDSVDTIDAVNIWQWDFAKEGRRAEGWTIEASSGANPWIVEKANETEANFGLQAWRQEAYTGDYSYTIRNIQNGTYTLGNDIRVTSGMTTAVMQLESGGIVVTSGNIDTQDKKATDYRLRDTIEVTNHEVTIRYRIEAPEGGKTFSVNNIILYLVGSVKDNENNSDVNLGFINVDNVNGKVKEPNTVLESSKAPYNNLQILNNMEGAAVEILETGTAVNGCYYVGADTEGDSYADVVDTCFVRGDFYGESWDPDTEDNTLAVGIHQSMYKSMRAGTNDKKYGGISILFKGSDPNVDGYQWGSHTGWDANDLHIETTKMKVKLNYTNVGYYKGRKINAHATIKVTPAKNRNMDAQGDYEIANGYRGVYYPMLQVSGSLYRGWVWQNVEEFNVELQFYYSDEDPETAGYITLGEDADKQKYTSDHADYYVVNSLNPEFNTNGDTGWNEVIPHYFGPEYVLPEHDIANAYIVDTYTKGGATYSSNINTSYMAILEDGTSKTQYAYNGSNNPWGGEYFNAKNGNSEQNHDAIGKDGWPQNSVMIMPENCSSLTFSLGQLARYPDSNDSPYYSELSRRSTTMMWATISTTPFTQERKKINIEITKDWEQISQKGLSKIKSVKFNLWLEGTKQDDNSAYKELISETTVSADASGNWKGTFGGVPQLEDLADQKKLKSDSAKYVVEEVSVTYIDIDETGKEVTRVETVTDRKYEVSGTLSISSTTDKTDTLDDEYDINESFEVRNKLLLGNITVYKLGNSESPLEGVEFSLQKAVVNGDTWTPDTNSSPQSKTTNGKGTLTFEDLAAGNYLLTETKTADGYILLKEPIKVTIPYTVDEGGVKKTYLDLTYTIRNGQSFELPATGSKGLTYILRSGTTLMMAAGGILLLRRRKDSFVRRKHFR